MNTTLDAFESALLARLRRHVAEQPAPAPAPTRRPHRRRRLAAVAVTGLAASVVAVFGLGSTGGSPAYAVEQDSDGDVIVTVHRLDDAAGLESALKARGIDADVSYDSDPASGHFGVEGPGQAPPPPPGSETSGDGQTERHEVGGGGASLSGPGGKTIDKDPCGGAGPLGTPPATLDQDGSDWVLRIPADSPLQDRHVEIGTSADGALSVQYAGTESGSYCGVSTMGAPGSAPRTK